MSKFADIAPRIWNGTASDDEMRSIKIEDVVAIKSDEEHVRFRPCTRAAPTVEPESGRISHVASEESADRVGDIIMVKGWDLGPFQRNPILQRWHMPDRLPLGTVPSVKRGKSANELPALITTSQFFDDELLDEEGRLIKQLTLRKLMPAVSVGFLPRKTTRPEDPKERAAMGLGEWGVVYEKAELLELSVVNVGAHQDAIARALDEEVSAGRVSKSLAEQVSRDFKPESRVLVPVAKIEPAAPVATDDVTLATRFAAVESQLTEVRRVVGALNSALSASLPALKGSLQTSRDPSPQSAPQSGPQERTKAEPDVSAEAVAAVLSKALAALRAGTIK